MVPGMSMADALTGTLLSGRYRLLEPIRSEEAGFAWEAKDEMLGRRVAVKELALPDDVPEEVRPGLLHQAAAMARSTGRLTHEGIITVYDVFEDRDRVWVITQLVAGRTLYDDITAKGPWKPERVALLGVRLCEALQATHISQMVHRDVRPGNVIIPDRGGAMLSDLATSTAVEIDQLPSVYIAPERRSGQRVTVAADLYGLGATLYFAAVGTPPVAPLAYPQGVLGKVVAGLMAADPATRMPLHRARDLLASSVTTPVETLDEESLPPPPRRKRRKWPVVLAVVLVLALVAAAFALHNVQDTPRGTPTAAPSTPTSPVGANSGPDTTAPQPPAGLHVSGRTTTAITLAWEPATDDVGIAGYRISRNGQQIGESPAPGYTDTGLTTNSTYSYTVVSVDAAGNVSNPSAVASGVTLKVPDIKKPTVPTRVRVTGRSTNTIVVAWTASTDDIGVTAYQVFRNGSQVGTVTGTRFRDNGLTPKTTYTYQVLALDAAGNMSALSAKVRAVTLTTPDTTPPSVPAGFAASGTTQTSISLKWKASTDNAGVYEYLLTRPGLAAVHLEGLSHTDTGLTASTAYTYQLRAVDAAGNISGAATVTVQTAANPPPPTAVTGLSLEVTTSPAAPDCMVSVKATITVSSATDPVGLTSNLPGPDTVSFDPGQLQKVVMFGPMETTSPGSATVSASAPGGGASKSIGYTVPSSCDTSFDLTGASASVTADCPNSTITGSVTINPHHTAGSVNYDVVMQVDGADAGSTQVTVAPHGSSQAVVASTGAYTNGPHSVAFLVTASSGSQSASTSVEVACSEPLATATPGPVPVEDVPGPSGSPEGYAMVVNFAS